MEAQYPLIFFTLFLCLTSGMLGFQGWLLLVGKGDKRFHTTMIIVEAISLVVGGVASFLHLHHWERIFNGLMHMSSGITQELIAAIVIAVTLVILFVFLRKGSAGAPDVPKWAGALALVVGLAMGFVTAHSYDMVAIPAWSNLTLYLYYYSSELVLGAAGTWAVSAIAKQDDAMNATLARLAVIAGVVSAVAVVICGFYYTTIEFGNVGISFHTTDPTAPAVNQEAVLASPFGGSNAPLFWGGAVLVGSVAVAICGLIKMRKGSSGHAPFAVVALLCALAGGVCFRIVLYVVAETFYGYF